MEDLSDESRVQALQELNELLSNQELKAQANANEVVLSCVELAHSKSHEIRANVAQVIASVVLMPTVRQQIICNKHNTNRILTFSVQDNDSISNDLVLRAATDLLLDQHVSSISLQMSFIKLKTHWVFLFGFSCIIIIK